MIWAMVALGVLGWLLVGALLYVLPARARRQQALLAHQLRTRLRPYLYQKALEAELPQPAETTASSLPETVGELCEMGQALQEKARTEMALGDTMNVAAADTLPPMRTPPDQTGRS